jgi:hypothetical protein
MKRAALVLYLAVATALLAGCNPLAPMDVEPTTTPLVDVAIATGTSPTSPTDTAIPQPTETPTPRPTATWVPTITAVPTPAASTPSPELMRQMDGIEAEVEQLRGLDETSPITRTLMSVQQLEAYTKQQFEEDYTPDEVETDVRVLTAFDFVPNDFDLRGTLVDLYSTQVIGLYDDERPST